MGVQRGAEGAAVVFSNSCTSELPETLLKNNETLGRPPREFDSIGLVGYIITIIILQLRLYFPF